MLGFIIRYDESKFLGESGSRYDRSNNKYICQIFTLIVTEINATIRKTAVSLPTS